MNNNNNKPLPLLSPQVPDEDRAAPHLTEGPRRAAVPGELRGKRAMFALRP